MNKNNNGSISIPRELLTQRIWNDSSSDRKVLLVTILMMVAAEPNKVRLGREEVEVAAGQLVCSYNELSDAAEVSMAVVRKGLAFFQNEGFLTYETFQRGIRITINDWQSYSSAGGSSEKPKKCEPTKKRVAKPSKNDEFIKTIVDYLNQKTRSRYSPSTKYTVSLINKRIKEGRTIEDFKMVIDTKADEWMNTNFEKFLQPETLFSDKHFESYLNQGRRMAGDEPRVQESASRFQDSELKAPVQQERFWQ